MIRGFLRGHPMFFKDGQWLYKDTKSPTVGNNRACGNCGKPSTREGHDGCLGSLSGVMNACCGHGIENEAYVQFSAKRTIRGKDAIEKISGLKR